MKPLLYICFYLVLRMRYHDNIIYYSYYSIISYCFIDRVSTLREYFLTQVFNYFLIHPYDMKQEISLIPTPSIKFKILHHTQLSNLSFATALTVGRTHFWCNSIFYGSLDIEKLKERQMYLRRRCIKLMLINWSKFELAFVKMDWIFVFDILNCWNV